MRVINSIPLSIEVLPYANEEDDKIFQVTLRSESMVVELTNIGCSITAIRTPDKNNEQTNIVAGFENMLQYRINPDYFGCVVGRFANRIAGGRFQLNGESYQLTINNDNNHLHGGTIGFGRRLWDIYETIQTHDECGVVFSYCSPDGEEGYPGNLFVTIKYLLTRNNQLVLQYKAVTDKCTPVSLTNHSYFNLTGFADPTIHHHLLQIAADNFTVKSEHNIPTGAMAAVAGTALDFRQPELIGSRIHAFPQEGGYDHNFVLRLQGERSLRRAAVLSEATSGRMVTICTDQPAIQLYTSNFWNGKLTGPDGIVYAKHGGVALETQAFPDSPNHAHFPNTILHPGEVYASTTIFEFGIMENSYHYK